MNPADMTPRARWAKRQVMPFIADHPDGLMEPVTLACQRLDDIGALCDLDRAAELYDDGRASAQEEITRLEARETELLGQLTVLQAENEALKAARQPAPQIGGA